MIATAPAAVERALRVLARHEPRLTQWRLDSTPGAMHLLLHLGDAAIPVFLAPAGEGPALVRTASLRLGIQGKPPSLPADADRIVRALGALLRRVDQGQLTLPAPEPPPEPGPDLEPELEGGAAAPARSPALAEAVHRAAHIAWNVLQGEDLYPHVRELGAPVTPAQLREGWRASLRRIQEGTAPEKLGLYVHIPFCAQICSFCYCARTDTLWQGRMARYQAQLLAEARGWAPIFDGATFTSVYIGGGTPSLLPARDIAAMFQAFWQCFHVPAGTQVIFEGNPTSLDAERIDALAQAGVTRLTIGVQALDPKVRAAAGRINNEAQVARAVGAARAAGIPHVNLDLVVGLPEQDEPSFTSDLRTLLQMEPDSIHLNGFRPLGRTHLVQGGLRAREGWRAHRAHLLALGEAMLAREGHGEHLGQGLHRTQNAANIQEYDLRRQNSSLLGLGFPARSHSFGSHYYEPSDAPDFEGALRGFMDGAARWRAVDAGGVEEAHKYLVRNFRTGFERADFVALFGRQPEEVAGPGLDTLAALGVAHERRGRISMALGADTGARDALVYRVLLYSPAQRAAAEALWGRSYEASVDYIDLIDAIVE